MHSWRIHLLATVVLCGSVEWSWAGEAEVRPVAEANAQWTAQGHSAIESATSPDGQASWKWRFQSDGVTPYDNAISLKMDSQDWSKFGCLVFDLFTEAEIPGRMGCQVVSSGMEAGLADVNPATIKGTWQRTQMLPDRKVPLAKGRWERVSIPLAERVLDGVTEVRLFCDGRQFPAGSYEFFVRNFRLETEGARTISAPPAPATGSSLVPFSSLDVDAQQRLRAQMAPPKLSDRQNPYSLFMCYPMWGVKDAEGKAMLGSSPDGKWHPEWQEALVKNWAELGLTQLHFYAWPKGCGTPVRNFQIDEETKEGMRGFARLCRQYGIKIGIRVDPPYEMEKKENLPPNQDPTGNFWPSHPRNPENELTAFFQWVVEILTLLDGRVEYVVLGDEIDASRKQRPDGRGWTVDDFLKYTKQGADAIHQKFPKVKVSMPSFGAGSWGEVVEMLKLGYAKFADAVAINNDNYRIVQGFMKDLETYSPDKKLLLISNGVGYVASDTKYRNPTLDFYRHHNDSDQAALIARAMYSWWEANAEVAPYYVAIRSYLYEGKTEPLWYGFFGFMDFHLNDKGGKVEGYPAWYAFQTIAQTFHDRQAFRPATFAVESSSDRTLHLMAYERDDQELLIIVWGENVPGEKTSLRIASKKYGYPVQVDLGDWQKWHDLPGVQSGESVVLDNVPLGISPTVIRLMPLVRETAQPK